MWRKIYKSWNIILHTLTPRWRVRYFLDIFKYIFVNENVWISIEISPKFVPRGINNNIPALVQIMAWHRPGAKPLSEPMSVSLLTHICASRPQWLNHIRPPWVHAWKTKFVFNTNHIYQKKINIMFHLLSSIYSYHYNGYSKLVLY